MPTPEPLPSPLGGSESAASVAPGLWKPENPWSVETMNANDTLTPAIRQLLVDAAAALEDLTDDLGDEGDEARRLAGRLRDAAAGRDTVRRFLVEQDIGEGEPIEVCEFRVVNGQIEVATDDGWEPTLIAWSDPPESAARDAAEWVAQGQRGIVDPDDPLIVTEFDAE